MDGVRSRAVCVSGTNLHFSPHDGLPSCHSPSFSAALNVMTIYDFQSYISRAKYGFTDVLFPAYKASSVCSEESLSFQMSQWRVLVTVTLSADL